MFIADGNNLRIRKVTPGGQIETVAGNGDIDVKPGPATASGFRLPIGLATDLSGNVYFADRDDFQVLKMTPEGTLSIFYKNAAKPWGVATDASGNVYVSLYYNFRGAPAPTAQVVKISPSGNVTPFAGTAIIGFAGDNGPATSAQLTSPTSICFDAAGNLYIADGQRVRKVSAAGTITTVAGNGAMGFTGDGGLATNASLTASGIAVDSFGNLFIADINQQRVRQVDAYGFIFTVAGNGIAADSGDGGAATSASLRMGLSTEGSATAADANFVGLTVDTAGNLYIPDSGNSRIRRVSPQTFRPRPRR
jgi:sugar lactone lactonase YvrE